MMRIIHDKVVSRCARFRAVPGRSGPGTPRPSALRRKSRRFLANPRISDDELATLGRSPSVEFSNTDAWIAALRLHRRSAGLDQLLRAVTST